MRETKRGADRTPMSGGHDVLICGASFAGLAAARELAGSGADVLVVDRYEIGERQTSACAAPTGWLRALGLDESIKQTFQDLVVHTSHITVRMNLPWTFSTFDYRTLCQILWEGCDARFETAKVEGRSDSNGDGRTFAAASPPDQPVAAPNGTAPNITVSTDRGELSAPLVVDALGWRRLLGSGSNVQPPEARLSRGLEVHPWGSADDLEIWIERGVVPAGYGWSFPADDELRVGVGSFDPRFHVKQPTVELAERLEVPSIRYQGNWIPHRIRPAIDSGVFFAGDSAGHCLPLTAEGIRTAFYFAIACGRELRGVVEGRKPREAALADYAAFSDAHHWKFEAMLRVQQLIPRMPPRLLAMALRGMSTNRFVDWSFGHYLAIAPPEFARGPAAAPVAAEPVAA
ncbi:MAG: NAD(P)/FAD-dependent oxidoreductase [Actinomycetota bacterium]